LPATPTGSKSGKPVHPWEDLEAPHGVKHRKGKEVFYLIHEARLERLLRWAAKGQPVEGILLQNWMETEKVDMDGEEGFFVEHDGGKMFYEEAETE
jgi:hypothetical protein